MNIRFQLESTEGFKFYNQCVVGLFLFLTCVKTQKWDQNLWVFHMFNWWCNDHGERYIYIPYGISRQEHILFVADKKKRYSLTKPYCDQPRQELCNKGFNIVFLSFSLLFTDSLNWFMETMQKLTMTFEWQESRHFTEYIKTYRLTSSYKSCTW